MLRLEATFPKVDDRWRVATFRWSDGFEATGPLWGRSERLPHDLGHYAVDAHFRPPYGFWSLAGQQAPFDSLTPVGGRRWAPDRQAFLDRVRRKHRAEMLKAESPGLERATAVDFDVDTEWPAIRRAVLRGYVFGPDNAFAAVTKACLLAVHEAHGVLADAWRALPGGGELTVSWPPPEDRCGACGQSSGAARAR